MLKETNWTLLLQQRSKLHELQLPRSKLSMSGIIDGLSDCSNHWAFRRWRSLLFHRQYTCTQVRQGYPTEQDMFCEGKEDTGLY